MKNLFIPYQLALIAKEKGFNEPCFTKFEQYFNKESLYPILATMGLNTPYENEYNGYDQKIINDNEKRWVFTGYKNSVKDHGQEVLTAPLYQQVVEWLREKQIKIIECEKFTGKEALYYVKTKESKTGLFAIDKAIEEAFKLI